MVSWHCRHCSRLFSSNPQDLLLGSNKTKQTKSKLFKKRCIYILKSYYFAKRTIKIKIIKKGQTGSAEYTCWIWRFLFFFHSFTPLYIFYNVFIIVKAEVVNLVIILASSVTYNALHVDAERQCLSSFFSWNKIHTFRCHNLLKNILLLRIFKCLWGTLWRGHNWPDP